MTGRCVPRELLAFGQHVLEAGSPWMFWSRRPKSPRRDARDESSDDGRGGERKHALPGWPRRRDGLHCSRTCAVECAIEREPGVADVANTLRSILVKAASEERRDARRESGWQQCPVRFASQHRGNDVGVFLSGKGAPAGQHLVDHGAERPDVTAFVDGFAPGLLRTHVGNRPQQHAVRRHHGG